MSPDTTRDHKDNRRLRLGMVGGGPGGFIGAVHRIAARLDDRFELVAAALSSDPARARAAALDLHIAPDRAYGSFAEMAKAEATRKDRIDAVSIVTPNHLHYAPAKAFLEAGIHVICDKPLTTTLEDALDLRADRPPYRPSVCGHAQLHRPSHGAAGPADGGGWRAGPDPCGAGGVCAGLAVHAAGEDRSEAGCLAY